MAEKKIRVMVAKPGLDGHDRGARVLVRCFRAAGFEVIYTGVFQTPEQITAAALEKDVDLVGLSSLSGAHRHFFPAVKKLLVAKGAAGITVIGGGIIPEQDIQMLYDAGIAAIFTSGATLESIVAWVRDHVPSRQRQESEA